MAISEPGTRLAAMVGPAVSPILAALDVTNRVHAALVARDAGLTR
ncbi:hypothetical protein [Streptomyces sp. NPDC029674]